MKPKALIALAAAALLPLAAALPSSAEVEWLSRSVDFGLVHEAAGDAHGSVRFVNHGPDPVTVAGVRPSCGCIVGEGPLTEVAPGDTASVSFIYLTAGRPGKFDKTARVFFDDDQLAVISLRGNVLGAPATLDRQYPVEAGPLRLSGSVVSLNEVKKGEAGQSFVNAYNQSPDTIAIAVTSDSKYLSIDAAKSAMAPGELATFSLYFNSLDADQYGVTCAPVTFTATAPSGRTDSATLEVCANITQDFSRLTPEELAKAPDVAVEPMVVDLGYPPASGKVKFQAQLLNHGKTKAKVHRVYGADPYLKFTSLPSAVKAGGKADIKGEIDMSALPLGPFRLIVFIITDSPKNPLIQLTLTGLKQ